MKKIDKQTLPADHAFQVFYDTYNANYIAQGHDGRTMWKYFRINKDARLELHDALLKEQGYICCYCGCRIDKETKK